MRTLIFSLLLLTSTAMASDAEVRILNGINYIRHRNGLHVLNRDSALDSAARSQVVWMANVGRMEHLREPARSLDDFMHCDHHPANRVVKSGYLAFDELFRVDRNPTGANVVPLPAANDNVGEIIAHGAGGPEAYDAGRVLAGWMNSPGHREEILQENFRDAGVAACSPAPNVTYWCVVFGRR